MSVTMFRAYESMEQDEKLTKETHIISKEEQQMAIVIDDSSPTKNDHQMDGGYRNLAPLMEVNFTSDTKTILFLNGIPSDLFRIILAQWDPTWSFSYWMSCPCTKTNICE